MIDVITEFLNINKFKDITNKSFEKYFQFAIKYNKDLQNERFQVIRNYDLKIYGRNLKSNVDYLQHFSFIYFIYNDNLNFIRESLNSIKNQIWKNIEIIVVLNGLRELNPKVVSNILIELKKLIVRGIEIQIIDVQKNLWSPLNDEAKDPFVNLWNLGIWISNGEFTSFLSHDDLISPNYCSEIIELFNTNHSCVSAAPLPMSIDSKGNINIEISSNYKRMNSRTKFTQGEQLIKSFISGDDVINFPGEIMCFRKRHIIEFGGIDSFNDISQIIRLSLKGYSGFADRATLFWRHHSEQTNKKLAQQGYIFTKKFLSSLLTKDLEIIYYDLGHQIIYNKVCEFIKKKAIQDTISTLKISSQNYGFISSTKTLYRAINQTSLIKLKLIFLFIFLKHNFIRIAYKFKLLLLNFFKN